MNLSFDNTEVAFQHKTDNDLLKAKRIFQMFSYPALVNLGPSVASFALNLRLPIKGLIKKTIFHQFCGGETIKECLDSAKGLYENGVGAILDYSVEGEGTSQNHEETMKELLEVINFVANKKEFPFSVFKVTGIADFEVLEKVNAQSNLSEKERQLKENFTRRFKAICKASSLKDLKLFVDAEESWIQNVIDNLSYEMMRLYNKDKALVFNTIQMYRKGRLEEIKKQIDYARKENYKLGFKLVRGAYMEKEAARANDLGYENPIQNSKADTDRDFNDAIKLCFENRDIVSICAGSHNEDSNYLLAKLIKEHGIDKDDDRFWFAQLYGMSDHISFNLAAQGYNVAKYLPYGPVKKVLPYLARRAKENSSVKGQAGRELSLISKEITRRKL